MACVEKIKVLNENLTELRMLAQETLDDALLLGCSEQQVRQILHDMLDQLETPYDELPE